MEPAACLGSRRAPNGNASAAAGSLSTEPAKVEVQAKNEQPHNPESFAVLSAGARITKRGSELYTLHTHAHTHTYTPTARPGSLGASQRSGGGEEERCPGRRREPYKVAPPLGLSPFLASRETRRGLSGQLHGGTGSRVSPRRSCNSFA